VHWGEEPLLELVEHLATTVREQPLFLLCLARPELLDVRPTWGGGRVRATTLELEALQPEESAELVAALAQELDLPIDVGTVLAKSEGNPLFVEETVRMLAERRGGAERIPDTLQALIAARIDRLPAPQRLALQRASVMGRIFMRGALEELSPEIDDVERCLDELRLRDLVVGEPRATISGQQSFKFKHVLIREVAYAGLAKSARADLHQAYAQWLTDNAGDELLEIRGFHLDQATRLLAELDGAPPPQLAELTAKVLQSAGQRALSRESYRSARNLLVRAADLSPTLERRYLAARAAWRLAEFPAVQVEMELVRSEAAATGDRMLEGRALTGLAEAALSAGGDTTAALALVERALELLEGGVPLYDALAVKMHVTLTLAADEEFDAAARRAIAVAQELERKDLEALVTQSLAQSYLWRLELDDAAPLVERALELAASSGSVAGRASATAALAWLEYARGDVAAAEEAFLLARALYGEIGFGSRAAAAGIHLARVLRLKGRDAEAEPLLREAVRTLKSAGDRGQLCEAQRTLAQVLVRSGDLAQAERLALEARETVGEGDRFSVSSTKLALGVVRAAQHRDEEAEALLREAVTELETFALRLALLEALPELVAFLRTRGRDAEADTYELRLAELSPSSTARIA
jgi:tetratricopeptide (TPR) repeat protein